MAPSNQMLARWAVFLYVFMFPLLIFDFCAQIKPHLVLAYKLASLQIIRAF